MEVHRQEREVQLEVFAKECPRCGQSSRVLKFPDFEYGRRVVYTDDGRSYALIDAHVDDSYKQIVDLVRSLCKASDASDVDILDCFDRIYGEVCDPLGGKKINASGGIFICPYCRSREADIYDVRPPEYVTVEVPVVTYSSWNRKGDAEKRATVSQLLEEIGCC